MATAEVRRVARPPCPAARAAPSDGSELAEDERVGGVALASATGEGKKAEEEVKAFVGEQGCGQKQEAPSDTVRGNSPWQPPLRGMPGFLQALQEWMEEQELDELRFGACPGCAPWSWIGEDPRAKLGQGECEGEMAVKTFQSAVWAALIARLCKERGDRLLLGGPVVGSQSWAPEKYGEEPLADWRRTRDGHRGEGAVGEQARPAGRPAQRVEPQMLPTECERALLVEERTEGSTPCCRELGEPAGDSVQEAACCYLTHWGDRQEYTLGAVRIAAAPGVESKIYSLCLI